MNLEQIRRYGDSFTIAEKAHAVSELRAWLQHDTWTVREGLFLLVGIDPHRSDNLVLTESGFSGPIPLWARITARPGLSADQVDAAGWPRITGLSFDPFQIELLGRLMNLWVSKPEHTMAGRHSPSYFLEWAHGKGYAPFWHSWAIDAGLFCERVPEPKATETYSPGWTVNKPMRLPGYRRPLYNVLKDAHTKGQPKPTVHEVLEIFKANQPAEVAKILPGQGLDYYTADGNTKGANLKAIREVIRKMTT